MKAEYVAMTLAARLGMDVAEVSLEKAAGKDVLLVKRFDRQFSTDGWCRRPIVSGLTVLGLDEKWAREASHGMKITRRGNLSRILLCLDAAAEFGLSEEQARSIVEAQVREIADRFDGLCEEIRMGQTTHSQLRRRAVLNPDIFSGCEELNPKGW
ncbi:MAG: HipA domain-containing protein [Luteolibacter sp.]